MIWDCEALNSPKGTLNAVNWFGDYLGCVKRSLRQLNVVSYGILNCPWHIGEVRSVCRCFGVIQRKAEEKKSRYPNLTLRKKNYIFFREKEKRRRALFFVEC